MPEFISDSPYAAAYRGKAKFFMVCGPGNRPSVRHVNFRSAKEEAERLALLNPGSQYYVLEATAVSVCNNVKTSFL